MGKPNFSDEFKRDAVAQITERAYARCHLSMDTQFYELKRHPVLRGVAL